jgi:hypothetical protein
VSSSSAACVPFTILATLCVDMPRMGGCANYVRMCRAGSLVPQCAAHPDVKG